MKVTAKRTTGQRFVPAVAAGVIALAISGCGEEPQPKPAPEIAAPPPAPVAKAAPAPAPAAPASKYEGGPSEKWEDAFKRADKDHDGGLSRKELEQVKGFPSLKKNFDAMDANRDGKVTIAERQAWIDKRARRKRNS